MERRVIQRNVPKIDQMISEMSGQFANVPVSEIDGMINHALKRISDCLSLDRSTIWEISEDGKKMQWIHQYVSPKCTRIPPSITSDNLPWFFGKGLNASYITFSSLEELPPEAATDIETFHNLAAKSAVFIRYQIAGKTIASITFCSIRQERIFSADLIPKLKLFGEIITGALYRMRMEEKYKAALQEMDQLGESSDMEEMPLRQETKNKFACEHIIGDSKAMRHVFSRIEQVALTDSAVLILGETGTGKGIIASTLHDLSLRKNKRMVMVNCAALPQNLIESELFGREKGAFTGSTNKQIGRFELADQGTLILDEIAELPLELQSKLLRAIQDGEFERLGSPETIKVNVRIFALTNRDLKEEVVNRRFRQDLYYRLNVFPITIPPLRERKEDIPLLVDYFLKKFSIKMQKEINSIPQNTMAEIKAYSWPGNVRELEHVIERSVIITKGHNLRLAEKLEDPGTLTSEESFITNLAEIEKRHILKVLEMTDWRIEGSKGAAILLGLHPNTLRGRMQKLGILLRKTAA